MKETRANKRFFINLFSSKNFLFFSCSSIFLLSIFFRSINDIGSDTAVYLNVGKKIAEGSRYYYDFFEPNFPLSFYLYALEYQLSELLNINRIIFCEIVINFLAILSILWSSRILLSSSIAKHKAHYNLIIISYFLGFFLRIPALIVGEFGTKTSLLLSIFLPYLSFSFPRKSPLSKKELIYRGCLMGLIPCLKPHYLVLIIFIELQRFFNESRRHFFTLDKLVMLLIGLLYLVLMIKFTPEFFEFILPIWSKVYTAYHNPQVFIDNTWRHLASRITISAFIFLIFSRLNFSVNDKILAAAFTGASILLIIENIATIDQVAIFYAITTICFGKFLFDLICSQKIPFHENKFLIVALVFLPIFDLEILPAAIFGLGGFVNAWWILAPFYLFLIWKKSPKIFSLKSFFIGILVYFLLLFCAVLTLKYLGGWQYITLNLLFLWLALFFFEKEIYVKISPNFSPFSVFIIIATISCFFYSYLASCVEVISRKNKYSSPNKFFDAVAYYTKIYAPKKEDGILVSSVWIAHQFPILNYLQKENYHKFPIAAIQADKGFTGNNSMFSVSNNEQDFAFSYFFHDIKNQLKNPQVKLLFINNSIEDLNKLDRCLIGNLEYYFLDKEFRKIFLKNFRFENRLLITKNVKIPLKPNFMRNDKDKISNQHHTHSEKILYDFDVYVRQN